MNPSASYVSQPPHLSHSIHHGLPHPPTTYPPPSVSQPHTMPPQPPAPYSDHYPPQSTPVEPSQPPTAPSQDANPTPDNQAPVVRMDPYSAVQDGRRYTLDVVQQPQRARMCGFGDKDRRPITPPPCVRLIVTDAVTGKEIDCNDIEHTMFVLNVDLWSDDASKEVNLVRHTSATPSISSTSQASFTALDQTQAQSAPPFPHILPSNRDPNYPPVPYGHHPAVGPYGMQQGYPGPYMQQNGYGHPNPYYAPNFNPDLHPNLPQLPSQGMHYSPARMYDGPMAARMGMGGNAPQGMFTRNLIGSLAASAFRLTDPDEKIGIWFILQDLSVRTEGLFRLRFSFVNVGPPTKNANGAPANQNSIVNTGKAPVLAACFSDVFQVYSAKKFPGVCESTGLSKCFVTQGIKIPIRKEGANSKGGNGDDDDDLD